MEKMAAQWDGGPWLYILFRGQRAATGVYRGAELGAWSTGIGGPGTACTLTNLAARGTHTFIQVGATGTIQEHIKICDIIINDSPVRLDGTSRLYVQDEYPAAAFYEVVLALVQACEHLDLRYHVGAGCTCASFYTGQCRTTHNGYRPSHLDCLFEDLRQAGILNFEMEGAAAADLSRIFGKRRYVRLCGGPADHRRMGRDPGGGAEHLSGRGQGNPHFDGVGLEEGEAGKRYYFPGL